MRTLRPSVASVDIASAIAASCDVSTFYAGSDVLSVFRGERGFEARWVTKKEHDEGSSRMRAHVDALLSSH